LLTADTAETDNRDFQFVLYGQAAGLNRELSAAELVAKLVAETRDVLGLLR
jgi:hypothetical protein